MTTAAVRVVIADDHPIVREGLVALLSSLPEFEVVGEASDGESAVREVVTARPDVVVLDLHMPGVDGIAATRRLASLCPDVAVLVLTMHDDDESVFAAMRAGARGYLVKGADQAQISRAVQAVAAGEAIFSPGVARRLLDVFARGPAAVTEPFPQLSAREREVLDLLAAGLPNARIAERLGVAVKTVANNVSAIFLKLQVADRSGAIVRARDAGYGAD